MTKTRVMVVGNGRMGKIIAELVQADESMELVGMVGLEDKDTLLDAAAAADVVIDFSHKDMLPLTLAYAQRTGAALVEGVTGYGPEEMDLLAQLGETRPVVYSANYSLGVAVLKHVVAQAAEALEDFDVEIVETHHNQKADAPSGTAKLLIAAVDPQGQREICTGRSGMTGARPKREIGVHALRGGTVAGTHEVHFFGDNEELELTHRAQSRRIFAAGAVAAAKRLVTKDAGLYDFDSLMF